MRSDWAILKRTCFRVQSLNLSRNQSFGNKVQIGMRPVLSAAGNLQPVTLKVLFIPFGIWMIIEATGLFSSAVNSRQPRTDINAPALMDPSHCRVAFQTPEGTVLLVMQSSRYAVFRKRFSALTFGWCGHLSASAGCTLPGLIMLAWPWIANQCHATCWSNCWAVVCTGTLRHTGVHVERARQTLIHAVFCSVGLWNSKK